MASELRERGNIPREKFIFFLYQSGEFNENKSQLSKKKKHILQYNHKFKNKHCKKYMIFFSQKPCLPFSRLGQSHHKIADATAFSELYQHLVT